MNWATKALQPLINRPARQQGMVTTFTGIMILVLLTLMMFFAMRVGVFEQRVSANDMRQKEAFHSAESGIHQAKEFFVANGALIATDQEDLLGLSDGWLSDTGEKRWFPCSGADLSAGHGDHPCFGEVLVDQRANTYFYSFNGSTELPFDTESLIPGATDEVAVEALLCLMDLNKDKDIPVQGCGLLDAAADDGGEVDGTYFMLTLLARGNADCNGGTCAAEAMISEQISNFGAAGGGQSPDVPLTTKSSFPPNGTAEVVPNPNAGGVGVPVSVWMNNNGSCSGGETFDLTQGNWATCEAHEWYAVDQKPDDMACSATTCSCTKDEAISYKNSTNDIVGMDMISDPSFPCDLFQFYFGIPRASYEIIKGYAKLIQDCDSLDEESFGLYWVTGSDCRINSNTVIGSVDAPVLLVSAASVTKLSGGAKIYGVLFTTDVEDPDAQLESVGTNTVYGSVINDSTLASYQGTFQVVWAEDVSEKAANSDGLGSLLGGWSDFPAAWE